MKRMILMAMIAGLLLMPFSSNWHPAQAAEVPPIAQPLVREGDLAAALIGALELGSAQDEAQAQDMLAAIGIQPQGGWTADYPVTPEIVSELENSIAEAADSQKLAMGREAALDAFESHLTELGLAVATTTPESYAAESPPESYPEYIDPTDVDAYYDRFGPPVVTYYLPPPAYYPLYSWIYCPLWYSGTYFSGYFILHSFYRVIIFRHRHVLISSYRYPHRRTRFRRPHKRYDERRKRDFGRAHRSYFGVRRPPIGSARSRFLYHGRFRAPAGRALVRPLAPPRSETASSGALRHEQFRTFGRRPSGRRGAFHREETRRFSRPSRGGPGAPGRFGRFHGDIGRR